MQAFYRQPICLPDLQGDYLCDRTKPAALGGLQKNRKLEKNGRAFTSCSQKNIADMWEETVMTGEQGRISVIVPVYKSRDTLLRCVESLQALTAKDLGALSGGQ